MKVFVIIITIIVVFLGVAYFLGWLPGSRTSPAPLSPHAPTQIPAPTPAPTLTPTPNPSPTRSPNPTSAPNPSPLPSPGGSVAFGFVITDISGSGFSRTITAEVSNSGKADAHNVWAEVAVSSGGSSIKVNGQTSLRVDVGSLLAGQAMTKQVTLSFGLTDGLRIAQNGATIKLTVHSDEHSETFSHEYKP